MFRLSFIDSWRGTMTDELIDLVAELTEALCEHMMVDYTAEDYRGQRSGRADRAGCGDATGERASRSLAHCRCAPTSGGGGTAGWRGMINPS